MVEESGDIEAGSRIGGYILEVRLGGGSFGSVWRARDASTGQLVAIKLLTGVLVTRDRADLRAEVELLAAAASSKSPHVVRVLGGGTEPLPYVVMEYIEGTDLAALLREQGKLSAEDTIRVGLAVADALRVLNEAGIIHRDVKPANIMRDWEGTIKLTDFGIAKIIGYETITMAGQLPMTMAYAAPEVWEGSYSHQSDLYALGIVLYQCLVGAPPFSGNYGVLYRQHASQAPDLGALPEETPPSVRELIRLCLEKDPEARPKNASECLDLLGQAEEELGVTTRAPVLAEPAQFGPWVRESPDPQQPWAWRCVHEKTRERATVEVHFAQDLVYGEQLKKAVAVNPKLVLLGAEKLLGTNRLLLRPGEGWHDPPEGDFAFWVAREDLPPVASPEMVTSAMLRTTAKGLLAFIDAAAEEEASLTLSADSINVLSDGSIQLRRPCLPPFSETPAVERALLFLDGLLLNEEARDRITSAHDLRELTKLMPEVSEEAQTATSFVTELGVAYVAEGATRSAAPAEDEATTLSSQTVVASASSEESTIFSEEKQETAHETDSSVLTEGGEGPSRPRWERAASAHRWRKWLVPVGAVLAPLLVAGVAGVVLIFASRADNTAEETGAAAAVKTPTPRFSSATPSVPATTQAELVQLVKSRAAANTAVYLNVDVSPVAEIVTGDALSLYQSEVDRLHSIDAYIDTQQVDFSLESVSMSDPGHATVRTHEVWDSIDYKASTGEVTGSRRATVEITYSLVHLNEGWRIEEIDQTSITYEPLLEADTPTPILPPTPTALPPAPTAWPTAPQLRQPLLIDSTMQPVDGFNVWVRMQCDADSCTIVPSGLASLPMQPVNVFILDACNAPDCSTSLGCAGSVFFPGELEDGLETTDDAAQFILPGFRSLGLFANPASGGPGTLVACANLP